MTNQVLNGAAEHASKALASAKFSTEERYRFLTSILEAFTGTPVSLVSIGANREETIFARPDLLMRS